MMRRLLSVSAAVLLGSICLCASASAAAYASQQDAQVTGDVNTDGRLDDTDILLLREWLLGVPAVQLPAWQAADLNADGSLDARDFTLMKRLRMNASVGKQLIDPPVRALHPSLPSAGTDRIPVFAVSFPDCAFSEADAAYLSTCCFDAADPACSLFPLESISAYFERASYGRLTLTGDVISYTAAHEIDRYAEDHAQDLVAEILEALDASLDFRDFDANQDQILDGMVLALPAAAIRIDNDGDGVPDWWPFSGKSSCDDVFDGVCAGAYCVSAFTGNAPTEFVGRTAHELAHMMGLPDYYKYTADASGEKDGLPGAAGDELMDEGTGDLSVCSKLLLGWLSADEILVYTGETQTFSLTSMQYAPACILIPKDPAAGYLSEYFLIEYITTEANNRTAGGNGIRILHVQAEVSEGRHGPEFTYNNYGLHYDSSNQKQRVLRLVNDNGLFYPGIRGVQYTDVIDGGIAGFHWYDAEGDLTEDTGLRIRINGFHPGPDYVPDPLSSLLPTNDPAYRRGSTYSITVSAADISA